MARNRLGTTEVDRIHLSDGDWIEVKRDLNNGDMKRLEEAGLAPPVRLNDGSITRPIDWSRYEIERAAIFITDWSFRGPDDKPLPLKSGNGMVMSSALQAIDTESFDEINAAILRHTIARAAEKKAQREAREKAQAKAEEVPTPTPLPSTSDSADAGT